MSSPIARSIKKIQPTALQNMRPGFSTRSLRVSYEELMDPFVNLDNFWMDRPVFPPHPHAGFSAVTYMFEDSEGSFVNQWSKGPEKEIIRPGSLHWTQAGSGMMHEEVPTVTGKMCHGLQMFVKLPASEENSPPTAYHVENVPEYNSDGVRVRVLVGSHQDKSASFKTGNKDLTYLDIHLSKGAKVEIPAQHTAFIFNIKGTLSSTDGKGKVTTIDEGAGAFFATDGDIVSLETTEGDAQFLFCSGVPNKEPLVVSGPFMMSTADGIAQAKRDYGSGAMGRIDALDVQTMPKDGEL